MSVQWRSHFVCRIGHTCVNIKGFNLNMASVNRNFEFLAFFFLGEGHVTTEV